VYAGGMEAGLLMLRIFTQGLLTLQLNIGLWLQVPKLQGVQLPGPRASAADCSAADGLPHCHCQHDRCGCGDRVAPEA
jgi:hypothetical protein